MHTQFSGLANKNIESTKAKSCFGLPCSLSPRTMTNQEIVLIIGRLGLIFDVKVRKKKGLDVDKKKMIWAIFLDFSNN